MRQPRPILAGILAATALAVSSCAEGSLGGPSSLPSAGGSTLGAPSAAELTTAESLLGTIPVKSFPGRDATYERDAFGDAWSDHGVGIALAGNGCDTRDDILKRDAKPGTVRTKAEAGGCKVTGGVWISSYTGERITTPSTLDIDHVVPLSRAWAAGAKRWNAQRRLNFANDPDNLVAVDRSSNRSKGDLGPGAWRPSRPAQCSYAVRYIRATKKYELPLTSADVVALKDMLASC